MVNQANTAGNLDFYNQPGESTLGGAYIPEAERDPVRAQHVAEAVGPAVLSNGFRLVREVSPTGMTITRLEHGVVAA